MKALPSTLAAIFVIAAPLATLAQNARQLQPNETLTNLPGATTIAAPSAGFDPLTASDEELQYNGFPPRPNQATEAKQYGNWVKAMKASKTRIVPSWSRPPSCTVRPSRPRHQSDRGGEERIASGSASNTAYSSNWSGYVDFSGATSYGSSSFYYVVNDFVVPVAEQAFGACTGRMGLGFGVERH